MALERQFHEAYKRLVVNLRSRHLSGVSLDIDPRSIGSLLDFNKPCPLFQAYGWDSQMLPAEHDAYRGERNHRKITSRNPQAQLQGIDSRAIISFTHCLGTAKCHGG